MQNQGGRQRVETHPIHEDRELLIYRDGSNCTAQHPIVKESQLKIILDGEEWATLLCSPHSLELLAIGTLVNEGVLRSRHDLRDISCRPEQGIVWVDTTDGATRPSGMPRQDPASRRGIGRNSLHLPADYERLEPTTHTPRFTATELLRWADLLEEEAKTFKLTGGVHEAALAYGGGFVAYYEDISRRNALDRICGYAFLNEVDTSDKAVILSCRISGEMLTRVAQVGAPIVVSRAAPTCLSIDLAEKLGITLVAFARGNSLNVYAHPWRITK